MPAGARICEVDDCEKPHRARGMCVTHYNNSMPRDKRRPKVVRPCDWCGVLCDKEANASRKHRFCSYRCRDKHRNHESKARKYPVGPVERRSAGPKPRLAALVVRVPRTFVSGTCPQCGEWFTDRQSQARFCSQKCGKNYNRRMKRWRDGHEDGVPRATRLAVYLRDGGVCQLCFGPVDMTLDTNHRLGATVDHIVCQSWTEEPDHSAENLRLAHRICNSLRRDQADWEATEVFGIAA